MQKKENSLVPRTDKKKQDIHNLRQARAKVREDNTKAAASKAGPG